MRVLVVEDDDRVVAALVPAFEHAGVSVGRAATGTEVVSMAPDTDGVAVCRQVRFPGRPGRRIAAGAVSA